jgi:Transposase DNA-binding
MNNSCDLSPFDLGDKRLNQRAGRIVQAALEHVGDSIPTAAGNLAATDATYRFLDNPNVLASDIDDAHTHATVDLAARYPGVLLIAQDTTDADFTSPARNGRLGQLAHAKHFGFFIHSALALTADGLPLGLLHQHVWMRSPAERGKRKERRRKETADKESQRWLQSPRAWGTEAAGLSAKAVTRRSKRRFKRLSPKSAKRSSSVKKVCIPTIIRALQLTDSPVVGNEQNGSLGTRVVIGKTPTRLYLNTEATMDDMTPITYRDFWDVPRIFLARHGEGVLLFDCPFDETMEDYPDFYQVYLLPRLQEEELGGSWDKLPLRACRRLGAIPVDSVRFDATRRHAVETRLLNALAASLSEANQTHSVPLGGEDRRVR